MVLPGEKGGMVGLLLVVVSSSVFKCRRLVRKAPAASIAGRVDSRIAKL